MDLNLSILYSQDEAGWWIAEIPEVPGVFSQGKTRAEAREMVLDAFQLVTETRRDLAAQGRVSNQNELLHVTA
jgi:predicted RNase H-like HicB family nuclease